MRVMPVASVPSTTPEQRAKALRLVRTLMGKTLGYFEDREDAQINQIRARLFELADSKLPLLQSQNLRTAAMLLDRQAVKFKRLYRDAIQQCLQEEIQGIWPEMKQQGSQSSEHPASHALNGMTLSLIDVDEVHRILLLDQLAEKFNTRYEPVLTPLTQKLCALLGQETPSLSSNPFRPGVLLLAFQRAWEKGAFDPATTEHLIQSLDPAHTMDLAPLYTELNSTLAQAGVQAHTVHRIRKSVSSSYAPLTGSAPLGETNSSGHGSLHSQPAPLTGNAGLSPELPRSAWGALAPAGQHIATQVKAFLHRLGVGAASDSQAVPSHAAAQQTPDPALLNYLGEMQAGSDAQSSRFAFLQPQNAEHGHHNVLRQIRDQEEIRRAPELDRTTVDALAEVFDYVFADQAIPMQMKVVIGRLQIPVLRAAMIDRDFFLRTDHPARQLVDTLASSSVTWTPDKGEQDPLYMRIEQTVQRVLTEFEDDLTLFSILLAEFTEFLFESEQQVQLQITPVVTQESDKEALDAALAQADEAVHARISALPDALPLAPFLTPFLTTQWREVLAKAWIQEAQAPGRWESALRTMDRLIWSTQPKTTTEDRRDLVALLPELVRTLNAELDAIEWSGEPRATFTRRLISTHMLAIRMKAQPPEDTQNAALEARAGQEALQALDQRRSTQLSAHNLSEMDEFDASAQLLTRGVWFEASLNGAAAYRCRLSWVSPMRTRFLFTNRDGFDAFVRNENEVAAMLRQGQLTQLEQAPIVGRALDHLMAANDAELTLAA